MKKVKFYENERLDIADAVDLAELPFNYIQQTSHALGLGYANGMIPDVIHMAQGRYNQGVPDTLAVYNPDIAEYEYYENGLGPGGIPTFTKDSMSEDKRPTVDNSKFYSHSKLTVGGRFYVYRSSQEMWRYNHDNINGVPDASWTNKAGGSAIITCFDSLNPDQAVEVTDGVADLQSHLDSAGSSSSVSSKQGINDAASEWSIWARRYEHPVDLDSRRVWDSASQSEVLQQFPTRVEPLVQFRVAPLLDSAGDLRTAGWVRVFDGVGVYQAPRHHTKAGNRHASGVIWRPVLAFDYWRQWAGNAKNVAMNPRSSASSRASYPYWPGSALESGVDGASPVQAGSAIGRKFEPIVGNIHNRFSHLEIPTVKNTAKLSGYYRFLTAIKDSVRVPNRAGAEIDAPGAYGANNFDLELASNYPLNNTPGDPTSANDANDGYHFRPVELDYSTAALGRFADRGFIGSHESAQSELFDSNGQQGRAFDLYDCLMNSDDPIFGQNCTSLGELVFRLARAVSQLRTGTDLDPYLFRRTYERTAKTIDSKNLGPASASDTHQQTAEDFNFGTGTSPGDSSWFQKNTTPIMQSQRDGSSPTNPHNVDTVRPLSHLEELYDNYAFAHPHVLFQGTFRWSRLTARYVHGPLNETSMQGVAQKVNNASSFLYDPLKPDNVPKAPPLTAGFGGPEADGWLPVGRLYNPWQCSVASGGGAGAFRALAPRNYSGINNTMTIIKSGITTLNYANGFQNGDPDSMFEETLSSKDPSLYAMSTDGPAAGAGFGFFRGYMNNNSGWGNDAAMSGGFSFCLNVPAEFQITGVTAQPLTAWTNSDVPEDTGTQHLSYEWTYAAAHQGMSSIVHFDDVLYRNGRTGVDVTDKSANRPVGIHKKVLVHVLKPSRATNDVDQTPTAFNLTIHGCYFKHSADAVYRNSGTIGPDRTNAHELDNYTQDDHMRNLWAQPKSLVRVSAFDQPMSGYGDTIAYARTLNAFKDNESENDHKYFSDSTVYAGGPTTYGHQYNKKAQVYTGGTLNYYDQPHPMPVTDLADGQPSETEITNTVSGQVTWYLTDGNKSPGAAQSATNNMDYLPVDMGPDPNPYQPSNDINEVNPVDPFPSFDWWNGYPGHKGGI